MRILLIDDDERLFELLDGYLGPNDVKLEHAPDGGRGLARLEAEAFDAVLLDVMMPGMSGLETLRRLREKSRVPVLMLTAKGDETDRVVGLELGADDYVSKPFSPRELLARLRAVLRRAQPELMSERVSVGTVVADVPARSVTVAGQAIELTGLEFDILLALLRRKGRVISRETLLSEAGRTDVVVSERTVDVHISHIRTKLGDEGRRIQTVRGIGYVLTEDGA